MAVKKLKPDTPSQRYMSVSSFDELTTNKPYRKLTTPIKKTEEEIIQVELHLEEEAVDIKKDIELLILREINLMFQVKY